MKERARALAVLAIFVSVITAAGLLSPGPSHATLYAVTNTGTVFESTSDGVSWVVKGSIAEPDVVSLSPGLTSGTLFALGETGTVNSSTSSGASWSAVGNVGASDCVAIAAARSGALLALTESGDVSRSTDGGATWTRESNVGASDCVALVVGGKVASSDTLFVATSSGDIARLPSGTSWTTVGSTSFTPVVDLMWISATLYAMTNAGEILKSTNAGATWSAIGTISQVGMRDLAFVGGKFKAISQEGEVYESATGASWSSPWIGTTNQVFTVAFAPGVPEFQTGVGGPPLPAFAFEARPSVFSERVTFLLAGAPGGGAAPEIAVFDAAGRRVAELVVRGTEPAASWDGRIADGSRAASGVYFARARAGPLTDTIRIVLLR
jgi:hypothetical protein